MKQIEIMRSDPTVSYNGNETEIKGRARELFRLLILYNGRTVAAEAIARLRDTNFDTVRSKVRDLRNQLKAIGCVDFVDTDHSNGYRAAIKGWRIDAEEFRTTVEPLAGAFDGHLDRSADENDARLEVHTLAQALNLWRGNPAAGLPSEEMLEVKFDVLKRKAEDRLLMARLRTKQASEIREAIQELDQRSRSDAEDVVWELLLLAHDALGSSDQVHKVWERIRNQYKGRTPIRLQEVMRRIQTGRTNPFRPSGTFIYQLPRDATQSHMYLPPPGYTAADVGKYGLSFLSLCLAPRSASNPPRFFRSADFMKQFFKINDPSSLLHTLQHLASSDENYVQRLTLSSEPYLESLARMGLGPVYIHRVQSTTATMLIIAAKQVSVFS